MEPAAQSIVVYRNARGTDVIYDSAYGTTDAKAAARRCVERKGTNKVRTLYAADYAKEKKGK